MSHIPNFTDQDFQVFQVQGLEERMNALKQQIRPKFEVYGEAISSFLTTQLQEPTFVHIAKHARRTVHPPEETWVAWSTNKRGYKAHPHFQLGLRENELFAYFALIYECTKKKSFARNLQEQLDEIWGKLPENFHLSQDHTKPDTIPLSSLSEEKMKQILSRLENIKKAEFLVGLVLPRQKVVTLQGDLLKKQIEEAFSSLFPLYRLAMAS